MGRRGCCSKEGLNRGAWTAHEDKILSDYIRIHGEGKWRSLPKIAGLKRCGKSCRLRWLNYLRPDIKRGNISSDEEELIIRLHNLLGNRWSLIAGRLPGRTDNEIKNYWNTNLGKKLKQQKQQQTNKHSVPVPPPNQITNSKVVRTKATKCSEVIFIPQSSSSSMHLQNKSETKSETETKPLLVNVKYCDSKGNQMEEVGNNGNEFLSLFPDEGKEVSTEENLLNIDFNEGDVCLSELLNSDFSNMCNFSYINNDNDPSSNHHPIFSADILKDCNFADDDSNNFHSFLESNEDILGDQ